jgi:Flp pilus assembly protein TadG
MTRGERGSAAVELVLLTPVLLVLLLFVVAVGRIAQARADVDAAARDAARAGTVARGSDSATDAAESAALARLTEGGVACRELDVDVDTSAFRPGGSVRATVTCAVDLGDLTLLRLPGAREVSASFVEPVDFYRGTR